MSARRNAILERRAGLVERAAADRERLADSVRVLRAPLRLAEEGTSLLRAVRSAPSTCGIALAVAGAAGLLMRWRRSSRRVDAGTMPWRLARGLHVDPSG